MEQVESQGDRPCTLKNCCKNFDLCYGGRDVPLASRSEEQGEHVSGTF